MKKNIYFIVFFINFLFIQIIFAEIPKQIFYQGKLINKSMLNVSRIVTAVSFVGSGNNFTGIKQSYTVSYFKEITYVNSIFNNNDSFAVNFDDIPGIHRFTRIKKIK